MEPSLNEMSEHPDSGSELDQDQWKSGLSREGREIVEGWERGESLENELCIHCGEANAPREKFCRHCRAPLQPLSAINPYERVFAQGFVWRLVTRNPRNLWVVLGVWLYFLPTFLFVFFTLKWLLPEWRLESGVLNNLPALVVLVPLGFSIFLSAGMMIRTAYSYWAGTGAARK